MFHTKQIKKLLGDQLAALIEQGKCKEVIEIIKDYPNKNFIDSHGRHPLHLASKYDRRELIWYFIKSGYELDFEDSSGLTPIMTAVIHNNGSAARMLYLAHFLPLTNRVQPSERYGELYLMQQKDFMNAFLLKMREKGFSDERVGNVLDDIDCPLEIVVLFENPVMTNTYLQSKKIWTKNYHIDIPDDMFKFDVEHIKVLLKNSPFVNNRREQVSVLLMKNIANYQKCREGRVFLKKLLRWKILRKSILNDLENALKNATKKNIRMFLQYDFHKIAKAKCGRDILVGLYGNSNPKVITLLKSAGIDANRRYYIDNTPLHYAASNHVINNVRLLLDKGADPNALNKRKESPLQVALDNYDKGNLVECVKLLLIGGANIFLITDRLNNVDLEAEIEFEEFFKRNVLNKKIAKLFLAQFAISEAIGLKTGNFMEFFKKLNDQELERFSEECRLQLEKLKQHKIRDSDDNQGVHKVELTMFNILACPPEKNARYVSEEDLQAVKTYLKCNRKTLGLFYREVLTQRTKDIAKIKYKRSRAIATTCIYTGIQDFHHLVIQKIFSYISAKDLLNFS